VVIEPKFEFYGNYGGEFRNGLMAINSDGKYVDTTGKLVIDKGFDRGWDFSEGLAVAMRKDGEKWGYIDRTCEFVISPRFETYPKGYVHSFSDGLAAIVIPPQYKFAEPFSEGLAVVRNLNDKESSDEYYYINKRGEQAFPERFALASHFFKGLAHVKIKSTTEKNISDSETKGSFAYIDVTGRNVFSY
jgi:hypothetical protein